MSICPYIVRNYVLHFVMHKLFIKFPGYASKITTFWIGIPFFFKNYFSLMRHTMWLIWFVGEDTLCMIARRSLGSFGWIPSSVKRVHLIHHLSITGTDSMLYRYMSVTWSVSKLLIWDKYHMSKMGYCSTTSEIPLLSCSSFFLFHITAS